MCVLVPDSGLTAVLAMVPETTLAVVPGHWCLSTGARVLMPWCLRATQAVVLESYPGCGAGELLRPWCRRLQCLLPQQKTLGLRLCVSVLSVPENCLAWCVDGCLAVARDISCAGDCSAFCR